MTKRVIFHIDVNSAYLSWEATYQLQQGSNIDLREIPSVIGGDGLYLLMSFLWWGLKLPQSLLTKTLKP